MGSFAVHIAKAAGARVLATAGPANQETLATLGADVAVDYSSQDAAEVAGPRSNGGYAEYHVVPADIVARKPASLSHEEAAAVPLAGGTAYEAIVRRLDVKVGETALIHGGAGGVGSFAVQIAKAAGARVLATAGPDNQETLASIGADVTIDYTRQDAAEVALEDTEGAGVDAVLDTVGGETVVKSIPATKPFGRLATILGAQGDLRPC